MRICADMRMRLFYESLRTRLFPITFELRDTRYAMASSCSAAVLSRVGSREEAASDPRSQLCHQDSDSVVREELDVLSNVYFEEMEVLLPDSRETVTKLQFHLTPSTADNKEQQFVYLDLQLSLPPTYPDAPPIMTILRSRGLADTQLRSIQEAMIQRCTELLGGPMIYELVEAIKEVLTDNNSPCGQCALCLFDFTGDEDFIKTDCYHYFHTHCLRRYMAYYQRLAEEEEEEEGEGRDKLGHLECPVCRAIVPEDSSCLKDLQNSEYIRGRGEAEEKGEGFLFEPSQSLQQWQHEMAVLLQQQRERGGVIDQTGDHDVIDLTWVSQRPQDMYDEAEPRRGQRSEGGTRESQTGVHATAGMNSRRSKYPHCNSRGTKSNSRDSETNTTCPDSNTRYPRPRASYRTDYCRHKKQQNERTEEKIGTRTEQHWNGVRTENPGNGTSKSSVVKTCALELLSDNRRRGCEYERGKGADHWRERGRGRGRGVGVRGRGRGDREGGGGRREKQHCNGPETQREPRYERRERQTERNTKL